VVTDAEVEALVSRARYEGPVLTRDQLVGVDTCLRQLGGQLALIARPELASRFGLQPSGTLLIGAPGTGKSHTARYVAGQLGLPFYQISADEFGSDADLLHGVFRRLSSERAILFIDEISILAQRREWGDAEDRRMLAALLTSLDGLANDRATGRLWVIGACTADIHLDPAIHRSGRLGVVIEFEPPSQEQRRELFRLYLTGVPHAVSDADLDRLAEAAVGATGADIRDWVSQAASEVLAETDVADSGADPVIEARHLDSVVSRRGYVAAARPGRDPDWEVGVHESAHAVAAIVLFGPESLAKVSLGFGRNADLGAAMLGHTTLSDDWARDHPPTSATWPAHAVYALAGVAAEQVLVGCRGGGGRPDVGQATEIILDQLDAADPDFGPSRKAVEANAGVHGVAVGSDPMRGLAWELCRSRFGQCWQRTIDFVHERRAPIETLAHVLLDRKATLSGAEIVVELGLGAEASSGSPE
jgi:ATP-dependent Zn protease